MHCKSCSQLRRKIQKLESQLHKLTKQTKKVDTWSSKERQLEAVERDRMMNVIERANKRGN